MPRLSRRRQDYPHLSDAQFDCLIKGATEPPGTAGGIIVDKQARDLVYRCPNCRNALFSASSKFSSGTGWPSFYACLNVKEKNDVQFLTAGQVLHRRRKVVCGACTGHLGHVFRRENWDTPTGVRYCINSSSIQLDDARQE